MKKKPLNPNNDVVFSEESRSFGKHMKKRASKKVTSFKLLIFFKFISLTLCMYVSSALMQQFVEKDALT